MGVSCCGTMKNPTLVGLINELKAPRGTELVSRIRGWPDLGTTRKERQRSCELLSASSRSTGEL